MSQREKKSVEDEQEESVLKISSDEASSNSVPMLSNSELQEVAKRTNVSAVVIHESVRESGERELLRRPAALAWSGLAAGLSMGFSLVASGLLNAYLPPASWRPLIQSLGYSIGFLLVILGRQQLFTENTLTVILPLLIHPNRSTFARVLRLWTVVFGANILGTFLFAAIIAHTTLFPEPIQRAFAEVSRSTLRGGFGLTVLRGIFADWLIALMVWLLPAAQANSLHIIILLTYLVSLGGLSHIIAGSVDIFYLLNIGAVSWLTYLWGFMLPTLIGNIIGGVSLVAALNYAQVVAT